MMNYVQLFIPNLSDVTAPLRTLLHKHIAWVWTDSEQRSYEMLHESLANAPVLPLFNANQPVTLSVDASQKVSGAVLVQDGRPVAFSSRSLTEAQQRYAQIEK